MKAVVEAMHDELRREAGFLPAEQLRTIYFGGGTPSLLPPEELEEFIAHAAELFDCTVLEECTVEANPGRPDARLPAAAGPARGSTASRSAYSRSTTGSCA